MLMQTKSISDKQLLWQCGFYSLPDATGDTVKHLPDVGKIATFCGVSDSTARRWLRDGLPKRVRMHFENLLTGEFLPPTWRRAGISIAHDRLYLQSGHHVMLSALVRWPFIMQAVQWCKVPP